MIDWLPAAPPGAGPRYLRIADAIAAAIGDGRLAPGAQLPPQRRLADQLGLDFTTVSRAYALARSRGHLVAEVGRGTFVRAAQAPDAAGAADPEAAAQTFAAGGTREGGDPRRAGEGDPSMNLPPEPEAPALLTRMRAGLAAVSADLLPLLRYQSTIGSGPDRAAAALWLSRRGLGALPAETAEGPDRALPVRPGAGDGLWDDGRRGQDLAPQSPGPYPPGRHIAGPPDPGRRPLGETPGFGRPAPGGKDLHLAGERVAVTPGAHATMLALLTTLARPGDLILCEALTYPGIRALAGRLGLGLSGVQMDRDGILPDALEAAILAQRPKALYLNPTLHNPTTLTMPPARRYEVAQVLIRHGLPLIEDDAYGFVPEAAPVPISALAPGQSWYIGGLSKCIGAGLRLSFTLTPDPQACETLARALRATAVMASPLTMALATRWIGDGTAGQMLAELRAETRARQALAAEVLAGREFRADPLAFNLWLKLPAGAGRAELMGRMAGRAPWLMPSDAFTVSGMASERVRVCLGGPIRRPALREGLQFLQGALPEGGWMG